MHKAPQQKLCVSLMMQIFELFPKLIMYSLSGGGLIVFLICRLLVSMAPLSREIRPITSMEPPHLGPAIPEVNSAWFKLFLYHKTGFGPPSLLLSKGNFIKYSKTLNSLPCMCRLKPFYSL